ncbi:MAG: IPTL-CTERM sorting domain-containing protein [Thermodesulfobacteriota bacterium]
MASVATNNTKKVLSSIGFFALTLFVFSSLLIVSQPALAQMFCTVDQVTNEQVDDSDQPVISSDGNLIAFRSEADFIGENPESNDEIFIYNVADKVFTQATFATSGNSNRPFISRDGKLVSFSSRGNINGVPNNGSNQLFLYDVMTATNTQITNENENSGSSSISGDNTQIAFSSDADLTGGNPLNEDQIFLYDIAGNSFKQITNSVFGITDDPSSNFDGNLVAFESSADLTGQNPVPGGIRQIYLYNRDADILTQVTANTAGSNSVSGNLLDDTGSLFAFAGTGNPNGGGSNFPTGGSQIYFFDGNYPIEQITTSQDALARVGSISQDGSCIVFSSEDDITGQNPQGSVQVFIYDIASDEFTQVTNGSININGAPLANRDCSRITFNVRVRTDITNVSQIFVASCFDKSEFEVPTLSEWGLIAMASILGIVGFMVARRRKVMA